MTSDFMSHYPVAWKQPLETIIPIMSDLLNFVTVYSICKPLLKTPHISYSDCGRKAIIREVVAYPKCSWWKLPWSQHQT